STSENPECAEAQYREPKPFHGSRPAIERERERERVVLPLRPSCQQEADLGFTEPPEHELERALGVGVEPLDVVDREQQRHCRSEQAQHAENRDRNSAAVGRSLPRLLEEQSGAERAALRLWQLVDHLPDGVTEQIALRGERKLRLALGRACRQDAVTSRLRLTDGLAQQDRLPDPRLPVDHERSRTRPLAET